MQVARVRAYNPVRLILGLRRRLLQRRFRCYAAARPLVTGKTGLEIGGPSSLFARGGPLPFYADVGRLDNCNHARATVWEGVVEEGITFDFDRRHEPGRQYVDEATDLASIPSNHYAFMLSSHTIAQREPAQGTARVGSSADGWRGDAPRRATQRGVAAVRARTT